LAKTLKEDDDDDDDDDDDITTSRYVLFKSRVPLLSVRS